ncbi:MAG: hypothetical protein CSB47_03365 [Proteobacteria bacterium]|nr:MAG: hypothetical protein CSB47_03365 [Pseudomonadota bacterium]
MDETTLLGTAELPRQQGTLHLFSVGGSYCLSTGGAQSEQWMSSASAPSRQALAKIPAKILCKRHQPKVLLGGLGLGYTLVEILKQFNLQAQIEVCEWLPEVREWHENGVLGKALGFPVKDDRVTLNELDIARLLRSKKQRYDAILLDTDNGPGDLLFKENDWLYTFSGMRACFEALEPMGVLAIWAPSPDETVKGKLVRAGFMVEQMNVPGDDQGKSQHTIWIAEKLQQD